MARFWQHGFIVLPGAGGLPRSALSCYPDAMGYREVLTIEPGKRGGKPCIRGLRITVYDVLEYLASGMSEEQILSDFPDLRLDDIKACLSFAADRERQFVQAWATASRKDATTSSRPSAAKRKSAGIDR